MLEKGRSKGRLFFVGGGAVLWLAHLTRLSLRRHEYITCVAISASGRRASIYLIKMTALLIPRCR